MDLEQYGVWVKAGPEDVSDDNEEMFALSDVSDDIDEDTFADSSDLTLEEEDLLASLEEEDKSGAGEEALSNQQPVTPSSVPQTEDEAGAEEDFSFSLDETDEDLVDSLSLDDFSLDEISLDDLSIPGEESESAADPGDDFDLEGSADELPELGIDSEDAFDDVGAVTREMTGSAAENRADTGQAESSEPISGIENELASIKAELHALRQELAEIRGSAVPASVAPRQQNAEADEEPQVSAGFFEEDDDETIALTDDELDNILNTAEFTEELGKPSEVDEDEESETFDEIGLEADDGADDGADNRLDQPTEPTVEQPADQISLEELDDADMIDLSDEVDDMVSSDDDQGLHEGDILAPSSHDEEITLEDESDGAKFTSGLFRGTADDVDALAEMDIDLELAGIEELRDEDEEEGAEVPSDLEIPGQDELDTLEATSSRQAESEQSDESDVLDLDLDDIGDTAELDLTAEDELTPSHHEERQDEDSEAEELGVDLDAPPQQAPTAAASDAFPSDLREEIRSVLQYMDQLLESLPEEKIEEFARSEHFEVYKRLFEELGLDAPDAE